MPGFMVSILVSPKLRGLACTGPDSPTAAVERKQNLQ
jgi:hypothetical protein